MAESWPFDVDDDTPPSAEELRYIATKLRESDGGIIPKIFCEIYADEAERQADSIDNFFKRFGKS